MEIDKGEMRKLYKKDPIKALEEAIEPMGELMGKLGKFIRHYCRFGGGRAIIGLSGGVDSSVIAYLCASILGRNQVYGVIMPSDAYRSEDRKHGELVAENLGINYRITPISSIVKAFRKETPELFEDKIAFGNLKARIRMIELYAVTNNSGGVVVGTDNKSEGLTGYFTKYGDGGVDINPIGELYKTQVRKLARHIGVPDEIIDKAPSAGLWENQTDEDEIGITYEKLDSILFGKELGFSDSEIVEYASVTAEEINIVDKLNKISEHKRAVPPSLEVMKYV